MVKNRIHIISVPVESHNNANKTIFENKEIHEIPTDAPSVLTVISPIQHTIPFMNNISAVGNSRKSLAIALNNIAQASSQMDSVNKSKVSKVAHTGLFCVLI